MNRDHADEPTAAEGAHGERHVPRFLTQRSHVCIDRSKRTPEAEVATRQVALSLPGGRLCLPIDLCRKFVWPDPYRLGMALFQVTRLTLNLAHS